LIKLRHQPGVSKILKFWTHPIGPAFIEAGFFCCMGRRMERCRKKENRIGVVLPEQLDPWLDEHLIETSASTP